ncbi:hypothetical protein L3Q82_009630, partial [Scortum barcoo]
KTKILCLNDDCPVALTSTIMKCFERLGPLQFAYKPNRSTEDAIALTLHTALSQRDTYVRMLFIDYSSAFNTIVPSKLITKLRDLGLNTAFYDWILNFLTGRPQAVRMGSTTSSTLTLNTRRPPGLDDETAYREEVKSPDSKTKELIVDFRRKAERRTYAPLCINRTTVERVSSFRLGSQFLTWMVLLSRCETIGTVSVDDKR